jgi:pimeloyl-ACP methyl ester carboxylesterase
MPSVRINGVQINFMQIQSGSGAHCQDLVMVHGLATSLAFWYIRHAAAFAENYRVTLYDLRGHGRSGKTDCGYTPENMAVDLQLLLNYLGIEKAHFVAHSFGGAVVLNLARRAPSCIASLMLIDTHLFAVRHFHERKEWVSGKKVQTVLKEHGVDLDVNDPYFGYKVLYRVAQLQVQNTEIPEELKNLAGPFMGRNTRRTAARWLELMETTQAEKELMENDNLLPDHLRNMTFPILAMYGEQSPAMATGEKLPEIWPHARFRNIPEAGHFFPITHPLAFMDNCRQFLNNVMTDNRPGRTENGS